VILLSRNERCSGFGEEPVCAVLISLRRWSTVKIDKSGKKISLPDGRQ